MSTPPDAGCGYLFKGKGSADPAIWSEFSAAFAERYNNDDASIEEAYRFAADYLEGISDEYSKVYPGDKRLVDAFREIVPLSRWVDAFKPQETER